MHEVGLLLTLRLVPLPRQFRYLVDGGWVLGLIVLGGALLLGVAMFRRGRKAAEGPIAPPIAGLRGGWRGHLSVLMQDLGLIGHSRYLYLALLLSLPYLLVQTIPVWASFHGYGFDLGLVEAFALMVILRLGSVVPQAPGNLGLFQFLTKEVLEKIFNVVPNQAARFSLVLWGIVTLPLLWLSAASSRCGSRKPISSISPARRKRAPRISDRKAKPGRGAEEQSGAWQDRGKPPENA